jgi:hypothetical protein
MLSIQFKSIEVELPKTWHLADIWRHGEEFEVSWFIYEVGIQE